MSNSKYQEMAQGEQNIINLFVHKTTAERYAKSRPFFHPLVIKRIREFTGRENFKHALDVGCGTGQSTTALLEIAERAVGIDISAEMLSQVPKDSRLQFYQSPAETFPFENAAFDLITVGLAFHWFEREKFLSEARRVLQPNCWLVIYNNWFASEMKENPDFKRWCREEHFKRYPSPPRNYEPLTKEQAEQFGFDFVAEENFENELVMTRENLRDYLMTQTNVIAKPEEGNESFEDTARWIDESTSELFTGEKRTFLFGGVIWFLGKKVSN